MKNYQVVLISSGQMNRHMLFFGQDSHFSTEKTFLKSLFLLIFFSIVTYFSDAQCLTPVPVPAPDPGNIVLTNGASVNSGNTYQFTGTSNFSNFTMNGGTLIVYGTLNITNTFAFNSGTIIVAPGATHNITHSAAVVFGSNSNIYNYGTTTFNVSIVTGSNDVVYNAQGATFTVAFNQMVIGGPNTDFVNNGMFNSSDFIVQSNNSPNPVCLGAGSAINTGVMINQYGNAFTSPSGASCVQITNQIINSQPMTNSSNVNICYQAGSVSVVQGPNFGAATINNNCSTCAIPLPLGVSGTKAICFDSKIRFSWSMDSEMDCAEYAVQRSSDGQHFEDAIHVECQGQGASSAEYSVDIPANYLLKEEYVRLKKTESNGTVLTTDPLSVNCEPGVMVTIYPTMVFNDLITVNSEQNIQSVTMFGMDGKEVQRFAIDAGQKMAVIQLNSQLAIGQYLLTVQTEHVRVDKLLRVMH